MPIIFLTSQGDYDLDIEAMRAGASDYLVKGQIRPDLLERTIRYAVERKRTERELKKYRQHLEELVQERTSELNDRTVQLQVSNIELQHEINERKRVEGALIKSEYRYRLLIDNALDIIYTIDSKGNISSLNPAFEKITGWTAKEWLGRSFAPLIHPEDLPTVQERVQKALSGETLPAAEIRVLCRSGAFRWLEFKTVANTSGAKGIGLLGTARDVTDRRRVEQELRESEERFRLAVDMYPNPFVIYDKDRRIESVNSSALKLSGHSEQEIIGRRDEELFPHEFTDAYLPILKRAFETGQTQQHKECEIDFPSGHFCQEVTYVPLLDEHEQVIKVFGINYDITERKRMEEELRRARDELEIRVQERTAELALSNKALREEITQRSLIEEALRESEEKYRELVENANSIILRWNSDGIILFFNEFAQKFFGYSNEEIIGQSLVGTIVPETESSGRDLKALMHDIIRNPERYYLNENENIRRNGERVLVYWTNKALRDDRGKLLGVLSIGTDITELRRTEKALRESESLAAMGRALSSVAHDIKTPLIAIGGFTRLVQRHISKDNPDWDKLGIVLSETQRLEHMVKDMLDFSRPLELERSMEEIARVIEESLSIVRPIAQEREVLVQCRSLSALPKVPIDSMRMKQVIINLVMNAVQASPPGQSVTVYCHREGGMLLIDVIDSGCGIPVEKREAIFSPFFTTKKEGTGLGLAIVKKIVEAHHGSVKIVDNPGPGVTFRVLIPSESEFGSAVGF